MEWGTGTGGNMRQKWPAGGKTLTRELHKISSVQQFLPVNEHV